MKNTSVVTKLGKCEECGQYFLRTHASQRLCPPPPNAEESRCTITKRIRLQKLKKSKET